jgi:hypothetical protein
MIGGKHFIILFHPQKVTPDLAILFNPADPTVLLICHLDGDCQVDIYTG